MLHGGQRKKAITILYYSNWRTEINAAVLMQSWENTVARVERLFYEGDITIRPPPKRGNAPPPNIHKD